ncbi:MAG: hypothetical protein KKH41_09375 [Candidatus Thermoplasmatota archaeon]|nr:hypothetical protein [Candidatus Thermoplasmatota archaeon]MBU4071209.1 hypothetical protein [Candidatus Thermoplasmatota archaeon]MBU4145058.1 hypothetical protein [Candidatus Thermoplasmatota archaeon]MBU4592776.1 hypothetical protein [Candidatus Thermoplasmatota archaeon]
MHAGAIAGSLKGAGRDVDIVNLRENRKPNLDRYDAVIIGSGVRIGRWYGPAKKFLKRKELAQKKIALFVACGTACDAEKRAEAVDDYVTKTAAKFGLKIVSGQAFAGPMPGNKKPVNTETSEVWGRELAGLL